MRRCRVIAGLTSDNPVANAPIVELRNSGQVADLVARERTKTECWPPGMM